MSHRRRSVALMAALAMVIAACDGGEQPTFESAEVTSGEVVQTVAAPAVLEPAGRVTISAPAAGVLEELAVADGDEVTAGDVLLRVSSDSLEQQLTQAEAAVESAGSFAGSPGLEGLDLAPLVASFRAQLDAVVPGVLGALEDQVSALEATVTTVNRTVTDTGEATAEALQELAAELGGRLPPELGVDPELVAGPSPEDVTVPVDTSELEAALASSRTRLHDAQSEFRAATAQLEELEAQAGAQADSATEAQRAAAEAQRAQAELALETLQGRAEALEVTAPADGVVQLARGEVGGGSFDPGSLGDDLASLGGQLGGLGGAGGDLGDLGGTDGLGAGLPGEDGSTSVSDGPIAAGSDVGAGQVLLTIYDLDSFTARAEVDELDIAEVAEGQDVVVLLDAFPSVELAGVVERIAVEPRRAGAGGALYPVDVRVTTSPEKEDLRVGLTASIEVQVRAVDSELVVPSSALLRRGEDEVVYVVRDGIAEEIPIEVLALGDGVAAIDGEVSVGDVVVTAGVELVEDGQDVEPSDPR
ncbi:MAG: HlyD family efflux transporter periplasmic adaptor subunit [Nitriliruptoraceae bacterium]